MLQGPAILSSRGCAIFSAVVAILLREREKEALNRSNRSDDEIYAAYCIILIVFDFWGQNRGYSQKSLLRLFRNGLTTYAATPTKTSPTKTSPTDSGRRIFLHLPYHPRDPQRKCLQAIFRRTILQPKDEPHFTNLQNLHGGWVEVERMIVAYHRQPNLRTLLFPRHAEGRCPDATPASAILYHLGETQS